MLESTLRTLERLLSVRRGDLRRGLSLFAYLFLVICSYVIGQVARDALFLDRLLANQLPYADISVFLLVSLVVAGYIRLRRRLGLKDLLVGSLLTFAASGAGFWWLALHQTGSVLCWLIYVWVGVFGVLAPAQVWTLANYVVLPREAKRLFGLVGSGGVLGAIGAGVFAKFAARAFGTESLLLAMTACLLLAAALVPAIWRRRPPGLESEPADSGEAGPATLGESLRAVMHSPTLRAIAALIALSSFVTSVSGWQFKAMAQRALAGKDALAGFFGGFNASVGLLALVMQMLVTPRLLKRFGLEALLFVLPAGLALGSGGFLISSSLVAVVTLKALDKVLRYSIDRPAVELLYLPLPSQAKVQVKSFIDTVVWRMGDGLAGLTILLLATYGSTTPRGLTWINLAAIGAWLCVAIRARASYVATLRESIRQHRLDAERASAPALDRATTEILAARLEADDADEVLYALSLFRIGRQEATHPAIRGLLRHPVAAIRARALSLLRAAGDKSVHSEVERLVSDPHLEVRTEALLYLGRYSTVDPLLRLRELGDFPDFSIRAAVVAYLARSDDSETVAAAVALFEAMAGETVAEHHRTRLEAARLASSLPEPFDGTIAALIADADDEVAGEAIRAAGGLARSHFILPLLSRIVDARLGAEAGAALVRIGPSVVSELEARLADPATSAALRREIPGLLARIGGSRAVQVLAGQLLEPDAGLRLRVIAALNKIKQARADQALPTSMIEAGLAAEILGHYRSHQVLATLCDQVTRDDPAVAGVEEAMREERERIFRLLGLLYPRHDLESAYVSLRSPQSVVHDHALDVLENLLKPGLRDLLIPLLDADVSVAERAKRAERLVGAPIRTAAEAVDALAASGDPWLRSCAAYAIGALAIAGRERQLDAWRADADPLVRETVREAKRKLKRAVDAARGNLL